MVRSVKRAGGRRKKKAGNLKAKQNLAKRKWAKSKRRKQIKCQQVDQAWDKDRTVRQNLDDMGLVYDLNKAIPIPSAKAALKSAFGDDEDVEMEDPLAPEEAGSTGPRKKKAFVVKGLQKEAKASNNRGKTMRLSVPEVRYCVRMMEKYGEDFEAMARDSSNHYQDTPAQIRKKINRFKNIPTQYNAYLRSKQDKESLDTAKDELESLALAL